MNPEQLQLKIMEWKEKYESVFQVNLVDQEKEFCYTFVFRPILREEYKELEYEDEGEYQEIICRTAVLYPEDYDFGDGIAGIAEVVSNYILNVSLLHQGQAKQALEVFREQLNIYDYQADCIIAEAFPKYSLEEIQGWPLEKAMYYLSRAEWILINLRGVPLQEAQELQQSPQQQQYDYQFEKAPEPVANTKSMSQEELEVMQMLAQNEAAQGRQLKVNTDQEAFPELAWFKHEDDLRGDFD
jgi:hypothetical protein